MRTAAGSAVATRRLARSDAATVAIIGTGVQSGTHTEAMRALGYDDIVVCGRSTVVSIEDAVRTADIVCATTHADAPVVRREWLRPGTHVNSVGYNTQGTGELDEQTIRDALVVVESRAAAFAPPPAGAVELLGVIGPDDVKELGEHPVRADDEQLTVYKSVGVAAQDAAAASMVVAAAQARGLGVQIDL